MRLLGFSDDAALPSGMREVWSAKTPSSGFSAECNNVTFRFHGRNNDLIRKMSLEERLYRHRCVEAWGMAIPWTGFPLSKLVELAKPTSSAKYVRMETFLDKEMAPGQRASWYPWPYIEGVTMAEAMIHEKDYAHARQELDRSSARSEKLGSRLQSAKIHYFTGEVLRLTGNQSESMVQYRQTISILNEIKAEQEAAHVIDRFDLQPIYKDALERSSVKS